MNDLLAEINRLNEGLIIDIPSIQNANQALSAELTSSQEHRITVQPENHHMNAGQV